MKSLAKKTNIRNEYVFMKECMCAEIIKRGKKFSWRRVVFRCLSDRRKRFYFWFRLYRFIYKSNIFMLRKYSVKSCANLSQKYGIDIGMDSSIGAGFYIGHFPGIVITDHCSIGRNLKIRQNTTIGIKDNSYYLTIGDNVDIGANSCIIGGNITIGDNVTIGAMSFVLKDIPSNTTYITVKESVFLEKAY